MPLDNLHHYLVIAEDVDETRDFYVDVLGLRVGDRPPFGFPGYWLYLGDTAVVHLAPNEFNDSQQYYLDRETADANNGTGPVDHIAFAASDLDGMVARFDELGIPIRRRDVPETSMRQVFVRDPNGVTIELNYAAA